MHFWYHIISLLIFGQNLLQKTTPSDNNETVENIKLYIIKTNT